MDQAIRRACFLSELRVRFGSNIGIRRIQRLLGERWAGRSKNERHSMVATPPARMTPRQAELSRNGIWVNQTREPSSRKATLKKNTKRGSDFGEASCLRPGCRMPGLNFRSDGRDSICQLETWGGRCIDTSNNVPGSFKDTCCPFKTWLFPPQYRETTIYKAIFRCIM